MEKIVTNIYALLPVLTVVIGALVLLTNVIVEAVKPALRERIPTQLTALIVALLLTLAAFFAGAAWLGFAVAWYHIIAAVIVGFVVAYGAMYGFDKLREVLEKFKQLKK